MEHLIEKRLTELGLKLPKPPAAGGVYHPVLIHGDLLFVSGQGPLQLDGSLITGKLGSDLSIDQGIDAARQVGLTMLATIHAQLGNFNRIKRLIKTFGMVNSVPDFFDQPKVINGFSNLFVQLLGEEKGKGARSAVGMILPGNIAVEVEAIFELSK